MKKYLTIPKDTCAVVLVSLLFVLLVPLLLPYIYNKMVDADRVSDSQKIKEYLDSRLDTFRKEMRTVAQDPALVAGLVSKKDFSLWTREQKIRLKIDGFAVIDADGRVLSRARESGRTGDSVFETSDWGQAMLAGKEFAHYTKGTGFPVVILVAEPIFKDGVFIGAIGGTLFLNDSVAKDIRDNLNPKYEILFYTPRLGVVSSSARDKNKHTTFERYFNTGSQFLSESKHEKLVRIGNENYFITNIPLENSQNIFAGILFLHNHTEIFNAIAIASGVLAIAFLLLIIQISHAHHGMRFLYSEISLMFFIGILLFVGVFFLSKALFDKRLTLSNDTGETIYNSVLHIDPEAAIVAVGKPYPVSVVLSSGGETINATEIVLQFNPEVIEIEDVTVPRDVCDPDLLLQKEIDNERGIISVSCAQIPGFSNLSGIVFSMKIVPKKPGVATILFNEKTKVFAQDGLATNVLRQTSGASYEVMAPGEKNLPYIFSQTHPNRTAWYNKPGVQFTWQNRDKDTYWYTFDDASSTIPQSTSLKTNEGFLSFKELSNGTYWFHLRKAGMPETDTVHFPVHIDRVPPRDLEISSSVETAKQGDLVRFQFRATDTESGLQSRFYIRIDEGGIFLPVTDAWSAVFTRGVHTLTLRVFDRAGNFADVTRDIVIK